MKRPAGLHARGRAFWDYALETYELSEAEQQLLGEVCRTADSLESLAVSIREIGPTTTGVKGQVVANPLIGEARLQRLVLTRMVAALRLPDSDGKAIPSGTVLSAIEGGHARHRPIRQAKVG